MNKSAHFIWVSKNNSQNTKWNQFTKVEVVFSIALKSSSKKKLLSRHELQSVWISHSWRKEKLGIELNKEYGMWEQSACCSRKHVVISIHSPTSNFAVFNCTQKLPSSNPSSRPLLHRPPNSFALCPKFFFIGEVRALRLSFSWDLASSTPAGPSTPIQALNRTRLHTKSNFSVSSSSKNSFRAHEGTKICLLRKVHLPRLTFRWRGFDSKGHTHTQRRTDRQAGKRQRERDRGDCRDRWLLLGCFGWCQYGRQRLTVPMLARVRRAPPLPSSSCPLPPFPCLLLALRPLHLHLTIGCNMET